MKRKIKVSLYVLIISGILISTYFFFRNPKSHLFYDTLSNDLKNSILWYADHEENALDDWTFPNYKYAGGGIFNTGDSDVYVNASSDYFHTGKYSVKTTITNAIRGENGNRAVRLMRWTDKPWDNNGTYFPKSCYFSVWMLLPDLYNPNKSEPWDPGDGGWWNVFQFKSDDSNGESQPTWTLNIHYNISSNEMFFYFYSKINSPHTFNLINYWAIPVKEWFHIEAFLNQSSSNEGELKLWLNGNLVFDQANINTILNGSVVWGIGNYTDHIATTTTIGTATIYFDDAIISTKRISAEIN
jgi:hypothetical protein